MANRRTRTLLSLLGILAVVVGVTGAALRALDVVARDLTEPDEIAFASVAELERAAGERLILPAYFPESLNWPPIAIRAAGGRRPTAALLTVTGRTDGQPRLLLAQTLGGGGALPARLEPGGTVQGEEPVALPGAPDARLLRVLGADGEIWYEARWQRGGRAVLVRLRGSRAELLAMAASARKEGP
jgi:hypothetical protein